METKKSPSDSLLNLNEIASLLAMTESVDVFTKYGYVIRIL
jgi:hypothetical protein